MILYATDRNPAFLKKARKEKIIDGFFTAPRPEYFQVDLIIFSLPLGSIPGALKKFGRFIRQGSVITDTAGTKKSVRKIFARFINYAGSHPLAGSDKQGYQYSHDRILSGHICILTARNSPSSRRLRLFWEKLGMKTFYLSAEEHDRIIGVTSHFVHFLSFIHAALIHKSRIRVGRCFGPAFRQFIRLARSSPDLWADLFLDNKREITGLAGRFIRQMKTFQKAIASREKMRRLLLQTSRYIRKSHYE